MIENVPFIRAVNKRWILFLVLSKSKMILNKFAQSAGAVEYTDYIAAEG